MKRRTITLTSKRQATFPAALCAELGVGPGDRLELERTQLEGRTVWVLRTPSTDWGWMGSLKDYGAGKCHDWEAVEASIQRGRGREPGA